MSKLITIGIMAVALALVTSACGCLQQTSTPSNQTKNVSQESSNVTGKINNLTTKIGNLTQGNESLSQLLGALNLTEIITSIGNFT